MHHNPFLIFLLTSFLYYLLHYLHYHPLLISFSSLLPFFVTSCIIYNMIPSLFPNFPPYFLSYFLHYLHHSLLIFEFIFLVTPFLSYFVHYLHNYSFFISLVIFLLTSLVIYLHPPLHLSFPTVTSCTFIYSFLSQLFPSLLASSFSQLLHTSLIFFICLPFLFP